MRIDKCVGLDIDRKYVWYVNTTHEAIVKRCGAEYERWKCGALLNYGHSMHRFASHESNTSNRKCIKML